MRRLKIYTDILYEDTEDLSISSSLLLSLGVIIAVIVFMWMCGCCRGIKEGMVEELREEE